MKKGTDAFFYSRASGNDTDSTAAVFGYDTYTGYDEFGGFELEMEGRQQFKPILLLLLGGKFNNS